MIAFILYVLLLFIAPAAVVGLVLVVINHYSNNRKYMEFKEEEYEGQKPDMPQKPYQ